MCTMAFAKCFFGRSRTGCVILIYPVAEKYSESSCVWRLVSVLHLPLIKAHAYVAWACSSFWVWSYKNTQLSEPWGPCVIEILKGQSWWLWAMKNRLAVTKKKCHLKQQLSSQDRWILSRKCLCMPAVDPHSCLITLPSAGLGKKLGMTGVKDRLKER